MGFTDETVRFNLDDSNRKEISETLKDVYLSLDDTYSVVILPMYLVIIMHGTKFVNMNEMRSWKNWYVII